MTFAKQIEGVPLELVRQGWRRETTLAIDDAWRAGSRARRWDYHYIQSGDTELRIARPVIQTPEGPHVYAHAGWGEGLSPTPEMVKVWKWWWYKSPMGSYLQAVEVIETPKGLLFQCSTAHTILTTQPPAEPITQARGEWRGPVLPPMEGI